jgi:hypothetical protein
MPDCEREWAPERAARKSAKKQHLNWAKVEIREHLILS